MKRIWGSPIRRLLSRGNTSPFTTFCCFFCAFTQSSSHGSCQPVRARVFAGRGVAPSAGPHQSPIRIKAAGGGHALMLSSRPLAITWPQKTIGAAPRPRRAITDLLAPTWVQPLGGSRRGRSRLHNALCKATCGLGQWPIRSGGYEPTPWQAHCPIPISSDVLIQTPWRSQTAPGLASHSNTPAPAYGPLP
jgi:hypothetical protein